MFSKAHVVLYFVLLDLMFIAFLTLTPNAIVACFFYSSNAILLCVLQHMNSLVLYKNKRTEPQTDLRFIHFQNKYEDLTWNDRSPSQPQREITTAKMPRAEIKKALMFRPHTQSPYRQAIARGEFEQWFHTNYELPQMETIQ